MPMLERNRDIMKGEDVLCLAFNEGEVVDRMSVDLFFSEVALLFDRTPPVVERSDKGRTVFEMRISHESFAFVDLPTAQNISGLFEQTK